MQEEPENRHDVTFIGELNSLKKVQLSSNFYVTKNILNVDDLNVFSESGYNAIDSILRFKNLKRLYFNCDYEDKFPSELSSLDKLEELSFFYTTIKEFPYDFTNFRNLKTLMIVPFKKKIVSKNILFPDKMESFVTTNDCEDIEYYKSRYPNIEFSWNIEL